MRRAAILITSLVIVIFAGCNFYLDDDDKDGRGHPQSGTPDAGYGGEVPDAGCGNNNHGDADGGFIPDAGFWPDASYPRPDAAPW